MEPPFSEPLSVPPENPAAALPEGAFTAEVPPPPAAGPVPAEESLEPAAVDQPKTPERTAVLPKSGLWGTLVPLSFFLTILLVAAYTAPLLMSRWRLAEAQ